MPTSPKTIIVTTVIPLDNTSKITFKVSGGSLPTGDYSARINDVHEEDEVLMVTSSVSIPEEDCPFKCILPSFDGNNNGSVEV